MNTAINIFLLIFLIIGGVIFAVGALCEDDENRARRMFVGFVVCVIGLITMKIL